MTERRGSTPMAMPMNTCKALVGRCREQKTAGLRSTRASQHPCFSLSAAHRVDGNARLQNL